MPRKTARQPTPPLQAPMLKQPDRLLWDIANGVKELERRRPAFPPVPLGSVEVVFHVGRKRFPFTLGTALETIANDLYFDERGDWRTANRATVQII